MIHEIRQPSQRKPRGAWKFLTMQTDSPKAEVQDGGFQSSRILKIGMFDCLIALSRRIFFLLPYTGQNINNQPLNVPHRALLVADIYISIDYINFKIFGMKIGHPFELAYLQLRKLQVPSVPLQSHPFERD